MKSNRKKVADRGDIVRFSIGEFSRITSLTIKSLRLYHEKEILIPAEVDEFTGYRYYNEANYQTALSIKILKDYDFTLAEIKEILDECEEESDVIEHLHNKLSEIQDKIDRYVKGRTWRAFLCGS